MAAEGPIILVFRGALSAVRALRSTENAGCFAGLPDFVKTARQIVDKKPVRRTVGSGRTGRVALHNEPEL
jgi:hypothetical protein